MKNENRMTDTEVNKILAELEDYHAEACTGVFVFNGIRDMYLKPLYTESLDSLVSAWEKLNVTATLNADKGACEAYVFGGTKGDLVEIWGDGETIQQAASHATAKAIIELRGLE